VAIPRVPAPESAGSSFFADISAARRPVVVTGGMRTWPALKDWTWDHLRETFGTVVVEAKIDFPVGAPLDPDVVTVSPDDYLHEITVREFIDIIREGRRCYIDYFPIDRIPGLREGMDFAAVMGPAAVDRVNVWMGSKGSNIGLHFDPRDGMLAHLLGVKRVVLVSPEETRCVYPHTYCITNGLVDPTAPNLTLYPAYAEATLHSVTLQPGEMLFIPRTWWHCLVPEGPSISVNQFHGPGVSPSEWARMITRCGTKHWLAALGQMAMLPVSRAPWRPPVLFSPPSTGAVLFDLLTGRRFVSRDYFGQPD
jgi:lysine-specific demethylase 8